MISLLCAAPHTQEKLRFGRGPGTNAEPSGSTPWGLGCHEGPVGRIFSEPKYCNRDETVSCTDAPATAPGRRCGQYGCGICRAIPGVLRGGSLLTSPQSNRSARSESIRAMSAMVGAMVLARAVDELQGNFLSTHDLSSPAFDCRARTLVSRYSSR